MVGSNVFDSIWNWFVKTAIKTTPIPMLQKGLKPCVLNKKTGKWEKANVLPRTVWKYAGAPDKAFDKWKYLKRWEKSL